MAPVWKGAIRFGLVNIPIALSGAETRDDLDFDLARSTRARSAR